MNINKIDELISSLKKTEEEKQKNTLVWILAVIGGVVAIAGIAFAVYRFLTPNYFEYFDDEYEDEDEDDYDDFFEEEE